MRIESRERTCAAVMNNCKNQHVEAERVNISIPYCDHNSYASQLPFPRPEPCVTDLDYFLCKINTRLKNKQKGMIQTSAAND